MPLHSGDRVICAAAIRPVTVSTPLHFGETLYTSGQDRLFPEDASSHDVAAVA